MEHDEETDDTCSVCGLKLVETSKRLKGVASRGLMGSSRLLFDITLECPKRLGFLGFFYGRHDKKSIGMGYE